MDRLMGVEAYQEEIAAVAAEMGIDLDSAAVVVAVRHGELIGDILYLKPLTDEQRRRHHRSLRDVMIELGELDEHGAKPSGSRGLQSRRTSQSAD